MKKLVVAIGFVAFASMSAAMYFSKALDAERTKVAQLEARLTASETQLKTMQQQLAAKPAAPAAISAPPIAPASAPAKPQRKQERALAARVQAVGPQPLPMQPDAEMFERMREQRRKLMSDPEYRAAMIAQHRRGLMHVHPSLARDLNISRETASDLLNLLAEQQMSMSEEIPDFTNTSPEDHHKRFEARKARTEAEIRGLLGAEKYREWTEYQQTLPSRHEARQVQQMLASADMAVSESQGKEMMRVFAQEQRRAEAETKNVLEAGAHRPDAHARLRQLHEERQRRTVDALASVLNSDQLELYRQNVEEQLQMHRAQERLMRAEMEAQATSGNAIQSAPAAFGVSAGWMPVPTPAAPVED